MKKTRSGKGELLIVEVNNGGRVQGEQRRLLIINYVNGGVVR